MPSLPAPGGGGRRARPPPPPPPPPPPRPNFLFVFTDDQRWDAMSCMGHPFLRTPHMDRIAAEGARFANAFVVDSLCSPGRACFLTGTYPHIHGVLGNEGNDYDPALPSFPGLLQRAGYQTAYVGKWHQAPKSDPRPGFDYWLSFRGQGVYENPELNENGRVFQAQGYMTDLITDHADRWLRRPRQAPFCLTVAHKAVHGPFTPAPRHANAFPDAQMPKPASFDDDLRDKPAWMRENMVRGVARDPRRRNAGKAVPDAFPPVPWDPSARGRLDYYRTLLAVDEGIGRLLETLRETGQLDNTVVVFASDNGYFHGEHRRGDKRLMYEESLRIPFLVRYPRLVRAGTVVDEMALNIDLAPTFLDLAGVRAPNTMQGRSLRPLLAGRKTEWRDDFLYEYFQEAAFPGIPTMVGVRGGRWSYVRYPELQDLDELYDLQNDPHQMRNLAHDPAHAGTVAQMRRDLERLMRETKFRMPEPPAAPKPVARPDAFVLVYDFAKDEGDRVADASGKGHDGRAFGAPVAEGRAGRRARRFDGKARIEVEKAPALDASRGPWSIEAVVRAEGPDGVVLARGGQSQGYALALEGGRPLFAVRVGGDLTLVAGKGSVVGEWVHLAGVIGKDASATLYVNGAPAGSEKLPGFIGNDPNEGMQIGADAGSAVGESAKPAGLVGLVESVRLFAGERAAKDVREDAVEPR